MVNFSVADNSGPARVGAVIIAGQSYAVAQAGGCAFAINPASQNVSADGGLGLVSVTTATGCSWTAASDAAWLTLPFGASGAGSGTVSYTFSLTSVVIAEGAPAADQRINGGLMSVRSLIL